MQIYNHNDEDQESDYDNHERGFTLRQILMGAGIAIVLMAACWWLVG